MITQKENIDTESNAKNENTSFRPRLISRERQEIGMRDWFDKVRETCSIIGKRFSVIPSQYFWRHRIRAIQLITQMQLSLSYELGDINDPIGPTFSKWRKLNNNRKLIVTAIVNLLATSRQPITTSMCEAHCAMHQITVKVDTIRDAINDGIELGLLHRIGAGSSSSYVATQLLIEEQSLRTHARILSDEFQAMARFAIAYRTMLDEAAMTYEHEKTGAVVPTDHQSFLERLYWGDNGRRNKE